MPRTARPVRLKDKWRIRWLDHVGDRHSAVYDSYRQADQELRRRQAEIEDVKLGLRAPPCQVEHKIADVLDYWLETARRRSGAGATTSASSAGTSARRSARCRCAS